MDIRMHENKGYLFISYNGVIIGTYTKHSSKLSLVGEAPFQYVEPSQVITKVKEIVTSWH